jgi:tetrahydromethanopterin S-methyltransferase subunit G
MSHKKAATMVPKIVVDDAEFRDITQQVLSYGI